MRLAWLVTCVCALLVSGCLTSEQDRDDELPGPAPSPLSQFPVVLVEGGETLLDCRDPAGPGVHVLFECDSVTVYSCRNMSDAVIEYESGARQRFVELRAQTRTFAGTGAHDGRRILSVAIETETGAGNAVLAQHFDAPADSCGAVAPAQ